jgi:hypothetical protein
LQFVKFTVFNKIGLIFITKMDQQFSYITYGRAVFNF